MTQNKKRNEAGTDASKIRETKKGTARSFSVPFVSKFSKFSIDSHAKGTEKGRSRSFLRSSDFEASVPASFLSDFRGIRSCLVPQ